MIVCCLRFCLPHLLTTGHRTRFVYLAILPETMHLLVYWSFVFLFLSSLLHHSPTSLSHSCSYPVHASPHRTACQQYTHLICVPFTTFLLSSGPYSPRPHSHLMYSSLFLLSGDTEFNPGPSDSLSARSIKVKVKVKHLL